MTIMCTITLSFQVIKAFTMVEITLHAGSKSALQYEVCMCMSTLYKIYGSLAMFFIIGQDQPNPLDLTNLNEHQI